MKEETKKLTSEEIKKLELERRFEDLKIKSNNSTKEDYIINKNLITIIFLKIKNVFKD